MDRPSLDSAPPCDDAELAPDDLPDDGGADQAGVAVPVIVAKRMEARSLYWRGWTITQIAQELGLALTTISSWKTRHKWDEASAIARAEEFTLERYGQLMAKDKKTGSDLKEIDLIARQFERLARVGKYSSGGNEADLNPKVANRNSPDVKRKKDAAKNLITRDMAAKLRADFEAGNYAHQTDWLASTHLRTRMIIKSRQIGATYYFARERLLVALETGKNQIFLSASRAQANIFRTYIIQWVQLVCGVELKGSPMIIQRGEDEDGKPLLSVELHFLGTNYRTAQGYHGDVIVDECFWIHGFRELFKVASGMATQKQYTRTLFSTPSTLAHEAYEMWSGEKVNKRRAKGNKLKIDLDHETLRHGVLGPDKIWRQIVNVFDAVERGYDLIDVEELQLEYSQDEFDNLFRCIFLDDAQSMFPFALMRRCMVDSWEVWRDYQPYALRPYTGEVWLGYDPNASEAETADDAALVAIAPPSEVGGTFRVLEKQRLKGLDFAGQAAAIREMAGKYNVTKIAIDTSGAGKAVVELVRAWFPTVTAIAYSLDVKAQMVLKAKNVISANRLQFDSGWLDMATSFLAIRPKQTSRGITYVAGRGGGVGHADLAWAVMHVLYFEPYDITKPADGGSTVEIF